MKYCNSCEWKKPFGALKQVNGGKASHKRIKGLGFRGLELRGLGFRGLGFRARNTCRVLEKVGNRRKPWTLHLLVLKGEW